MDFGDVIAASNKLASCSDFTRRTLAAIHALVGDRLEHAECRSVLVGGEWGGISYWNAGKRLFRVDPKREHVAVEVEPDGVNALSDVLRPKLRIRERWIDLTPDNIDEALRFLETRII